MLLFLFKRLLPFIVLHSAFSFSDNECLSSQFETTVSHKSQPFGLLEKTISFSKNICQIEVSFKRYKFLNDKWKIDVCRSPVHVKKGAQSVEVLRKEHSCEQGGGDFCQEWKTLSRAIQDNGLIFAEGSKESLSDDHGRVHCVYNLLNAHLNSDIIFSTSKDYDNIQSLIKNGGQLKSSPLQEIKRSEAPTPVIEGDKSLEIKKEEPEVGTF